MQSRTLKNIFLNTFWLSLFLHLLLLLAFSVVIISPQSAFVPPQQQAAHYVPSYVYSGGTPKVVRTAQIKPEPVREQKSQERPKPTPVDKHAISLGSILSSTNRVLQQQQYDAVAASLKNEEPMYLIGDNSHPADPLLKLLGRSLSAHFSYPRLAGEMGIKGRVVVSLTLHPEGYYSDIQMVRSSENPDLDAAALRAVNMAPTVTGADRFINKPKHFVIGFVFR